MCPTLRYAKVDCVKRVTMTLVIKVGVIGVETQVYGVGCVVVVKKIESRHDISTDSRKRILSCQEQQTSPECNLLAFDSR